MNSAAASTNPKPDIFVDSGGYLHAMKEGLVQCQRCGSRVFSRNADAIAHWKLAHSKCCRLRSSDPRSR